MAVVGERHDARFVHRADRREFFARDPFGDRARRENIHASLGFRLFQNPRDDARAVHRRRGIWHADHAGESARRRGARAGGDRFLGRLARLAQVHVQVDQARRNDQPGAIDHRRRCFSRTRGIERSKGSVSNQEIADGIAMICRIDDAAVFEERLFQRITRYFAARAGAEVKHGHAHGEAVGDLLENDAARAVGEVAVDLHAAIDRAGMHDQRVRVAGVRRALW